MLKRRAGKVMRNALVEFHIVPNGDRWDVERDDTFTGAFAYQVNTAIGLAISAAHNVHDEGVDVMVCVQEPDGTCRKVWP
jgi:hypothetical protein